MGHSAAREVVHLGGVRRVHAVLSTHPMHLCVRVCDRVCVRVRVCARVRMCVCVCVRVYQCCSYVWILRWVRVSYVTDSSNRY